MELFVIIFIGVVAIIALALTIWTIITAFSKPRDFSVLYLSLMFAVLASVPVYYFVDGLLTYTGKPTITSCEVLDDGSFLFRDSTRFCHEEKESVDVFTTIKTDKELYKTDTCIICNQLFCHHFRIQYTESGRLYWCVPERD